MTTQSDLLSIVIKEMETALLVIKPFTFSTQIPMFLLFLLFELG